MRLWKECTTVEKSWLVFLAISYLLLLTWNKLDGFSFAIACAGSLCIFFAAKAKIETFYVGIVYNLLYAYHCFAVGDALIFYLHLLFHLPLQFVGIHYWRKNAIGHPTVQESILLRHLFPKGWIAVLLGLLFITAFAAQVILSLNSKLPNLVILAFTFSVVANILMVGRFKECWVAWIAVNVFNIGYWAYLSFDMQPIYISLFMMSMFLIHCIYGCYSWHKIVQLQNNMYLGPYCVLEPATSLKKSSPMWQKSTHKAWLSFKR